MWWLVVNEVHCPDLFGVSGYTIEQVMRKGDRKSAQAGLRYVMAEWLFGVEDLAIGIRIYEFSFKSPI